MGKGPSVLGPSSAGTPDQCDLGEPTHPSTGHTWCTVVCSMPVYTMFPSQVGPG